MPLITERRIVQQDWYETDCTKTGWDSHGWCFNDGIGESMPNDWTIMEHIRMDKHGNPLIGVAEKETTID